MSILLPHDMDLLQHTPPPICFITFRAASYIDTLYTNAWRIRNQWYSGYGFEQTTGLWVLKFSYNYQCPANANLLKSSKMSYKFYDKTLEMMASHVSKKKVVKKQVSVRLKANFA
jgi:hypothetical protein